MTLNVHDSWLTLYDEWPVNQIDLTNCNAQGSWEVKPENIMPVYNRALIEIYVNDCFNDINITNNAGVQDIIINFKDSNIRFSNNLQILGPETNLFIISSKDALFKNIITTNIGEITYISGLYKKLEGANGKILYDNAENGIWIDGLSTKALSIASSKIVLAGLIDMDIRFMVKAFGSKYYNLDTQRLQLLTTNMLKIAPQNSNTHDVNINLLGNIITFTTSIEGDNLLIGKNTILTEWFSAKFTNNVEVSCKLHAASIEISSNKLKINADSEIKSINFQAPNQLYTAQPIKLGARSNFVAEEGARFISGSHFIARVDGNLSFNATIEAIRDIIFEGAAKYKKIGVTATLITYTGNIFIKNTKAMLDELVINGLVIAEKGKIDYQSNGNFKTSGISASGFGIEIAKAKDVQINAADQIVLRRWQEGIQQEQKIYATLLTLNNEISITSDQVSFNDGANVLNEGNIDSNNPIAGRIQIISNSFIYHFGSDITANGNIIQQANGKNSEGYGILFLNKASINSKAGKVTENAKYKAQLEGSLTGYNGVYFQVECLQTNSDGLIFGSGGNVEINLSNCAFNNYGSIYSNITLKLTVDGGNVENHNVMAGDDMIVTIHSRKDFTNYGRIYTNNLARFGLETNAKVLFIPGSLLNVGSYIIGHFKDPLNLRIGEVECHGCEIISIKSVDSIISAETVLVRITHYQKEQHATDQKTLLTNSWKERKKCLGITVNVKHHQSYATLSLNEDSHNYYGPAQMGHGGNVIFNVRMLSVYLSSITGEGKAHFTSPAIVQVVNEQIQKTISVNRNDITHINTIQNVESHFGLQNTDVNYTPDGRTVIISQTTESINSIIDFKQGYEGSFMGINIGASGTTGNIPQILPGASNDNIATVTPNNMDSHDKTIILINWQTGVTEIETITPEYLKTHGFDISKLINRSMLNKNVWRNIFEQIPTLPTSSSDGYTIQPIFFLKGNAQLEHAFINDPLPMVHFLADLAFTEKGLVYVIGDGHFVRKLVDESVFRLLGILTGEDGTKLLNSLALNARYEKSKQPDMIAGIEPSAQNRAAFESSIIWPVWLENCIGSERCLTFKLYFNDKALQNTLSGAVMASEGSIDLKILGNVLVGLGGQIKSGEAIRFDLQGNFVNLGTLTSNQGINITAENIGHAGVVNATGDVNLKANNTIVNIGTTLVKDGNVRLEAGKDIKELILINQASPMPNLTKRAFYSIDGNLYYEAANDIFQQATVMFVTGNVKMHAGHDITQETIHNSRIVKEEYGRKYYSIERTVDQYDMMLIIEGNVELDAGNNYRGSGIKVSSGGDINIEAVNKANLESTTAYAHHEYGAKKNRLLGSSKITMRWTTSTTANLEIIAPGGKIYISSAQCMLEGVTLQGNKLVLRCDQLIEEPHEVKNTESIETSRNGLLAPKVPIIELAKSDNKGQHIKENSIIGSIEQLFKMQGPTDLLPAISLIASLPSFKADFNTLQGLGANTPVALFGALLSKYISATVSFGTQRTETHRTETRSVQSNIEGDSCEIIGRDGTSGNYAYLSGNYNCGESLYIAFDNVKLAGAQDKLEQTHEASGESFDVSINLSGVSGGVSAYEAISSFEQTTNKPGTFTSKQVTIIVNEKLEIEGAIVNGQVVDIKASEIEIKQVLDTIRQEQESSSMSVGVTVSWAGAVTPYGSFNHADGVQQSQLVRFISGISGESVSITTKHLMYNIASISGREDLKIEADKITHTAMPEGEQIDQEAKIMLALSAGSDGKMRGSIAGSYKDDDFVISGGYFSAFSEGLGIIKQGMDKIIAPHVNDPEVANDNTKQAKFLNEQESIAEYAKETDEILKTVLQADKPKVKELIEQVSEVQKTIILQRELPPLDGVEANHGIRESAESSAAKSVAHAIVKAAEKFNDFSEQYPNLATYGLSVLNVGIQTIIGGAVGFVNGIKSEGIGYAVYQALEEPTKIALDKLISETTKATAKKFPELTESETRALAAGIVIGGAALTAGAFAIKHIIKNIDDFHYHDVKLGDVRLDSQISAAAKEFFDNISIYERKSAEVMNKQIEKWYPKPPFTEKSIVDVFKVDNTMQEKFVRFYKYDPKTQNVKGQFIALRDDVFDNNGKLLPSSIIKEIYDLPELPTHISYVNPPIGTEIAAGIVKPGNFGGKGSILLLKHSLHGSAKEKL
jgi:hypothetical protein